MKKETVIRQNRCDQEMSFLLFGCFFLFLAMQLLGRGTKQLLLADRLTRTLCLACAPGFVFQAGYCFERNVRLKPEEKAKAWARNQSGLCYVLFLFLAAGQAVVSMKLPLRSSIADILTAVMIPEASAVFFSLALLMLLVWVFFEGIHRLAAHWKWMAAAGLAALCCSFLRTGQESYAVMAAFLGREGLVSVPVIPYFAYFLLGIWFEEKKPGFQWKLLLTAAAVTGLSVLLYRTPLSALCLVTVSALPVYLIYAAAEGLSEVTLRSRTAQFVCRSAGPVFVAGALLLFALTGRGSVLGYGIRPALLTGAALALLIYAALLGFAFFVWGYGKAGNWMKDKVRHKTAAYFTVYTLVFALLLFLVFLDFIRFDRSLLWREDGVTQYYPRAVFFAEYIRELFSNCLHGNFTLPMYDFRLGMGAEVTYSLEPLYFLYALFGEKHVEFTYSLLVLLRFYLAGITSSILFLYFKKDYFTTFLASVVYVFCGFSLYGGARHSMFMIPMIMLPLLVIAVEEILRDRRWYLCTIFVALSLFCNYYYLYMNTIGLAIYFLVRFFCQKEKERRTLRNFIRKGLTIGGTYLLGIAMSCIVLVTTFGLYVSSGRSGEVVIKTPSLFFYRPEWLVRCFLSFLTTANSPGEWLKLGFLPVAFLAVVFLFLRKGRKELKILSVIALALMAFPLAGFVFSGFSSVINRWCYMLALLVAFIVADCYQDMLRMTGRELAICAGWVGIYGVLAFFGNYLQTRYTRLAFVCLVLTFAVLLFCQEKRKKWKEPARQCMMLLLTFAMVLTSGHTLFSMDGVVKEYVKPGEAKTLAEDTPLAAVSRLEDDSFYRVATPKLDSRTISSSLLHDYNGITMFCSTFNASIIEYLEKLGSTSYTIIRLFGMNNSTFMDALASVKYYGCYGEPERALPYGYEEVLRTEVNGKETIFWENNYALPLGYTYREAISPEEFEEYGMVERQEVLMQRAVLNSSRPTGCTDVQITTEPLEILSKEENGARLTEHALTGGTQETDKNRLTLHFQSQPDAETYLVLHGAWLEGDMSEQGITLSFQTEGSSFTYKFRAEDDRYGTGQKDYVFNLGYHKTAIDSCTIEMDRDGVIQFDSLELYCQPMKHTADYTQALTEDVLEHVKLETNQVSGTISLDEDKILVLSIPYQNGWTAYVDDEPVTLERANYMYMGLKLPAGEHTVRLEFEIPGVRYALVIMLAAAVLFVLLCVLSHLRKKKKAAQHAGS